MKDKIRLVMGRPLDAPFANSVPVLALLAALFIAGSLLLYAGTGDTLFLSRENAQAKEITVEKCELAGQDSYVPRLEIVSSEGETFTLLKSQVGNWLEVLEKAIEPGDHVTLRLSRRGNVLEVQEDDLVHLDFAQSKRAVVWDVIAGAGTALVFDLLAALLIVRCIVLRMNRKSAFRFGPAR